MDPAQSAHILLNAELDDAYARLVAGIDPSTVLTPVFDLLSITKENVYTSDGVLMLKSAMSVPGVSAVVAGKLKSASGPLRDRLSQVQ